MRTKKDQTRQRIIDAAYKSFWRSGFTRTNVDSIADQADVTSERFIRANAHAWQSKVHRCCNTRRKTAH
jgi:hypothetical protein